MIPSKEEIERLSRNVWFKDACNLTSCADCDWAKDKKDCVTLAREYIKENK